MSREVSNMLKLGTPLGYYVVNVKKSTWTVLGFVVDLLCAGGAASATLGALGIIGQSISRLKEANKEICVYTELLCYKEGQLTEAV